MKVNGWGEERKINDELAMPFLVRDREQGLKQNLSQMESSLNYIYSCNLSVHRAPDIYVVRVVSNPTSYSMYNMYKTYYMYNITTFFFIKSSSLEWFKFIHQAASIFSLFGNQPTGQEFLTLNRAAI
jgi:hypothetical protein